MAFHAVFPRHKVHFVMVVGRDFSFLLLQNTAMTPSNYQRTRWLTLIGTSLPSLRLGRFIPGACLTARFRQAGCAGKPGRFLFRLVKSGLAISSSVAGKLQERFGVKRSPSLPAFCWD